MQGDSGSQRATAGSGTQMSLGTLLEGEPLLASLLSTRLTPEHVPEQGLGTERQTQIPRAPEASSQDSPKACILWIQHLPKRSRDAQRSAEESPYPLLGETLQGEPWQGPQGDEASLNAAQGIGPRPLGSWTQRQDQPLFQPSISPLPSLPCQVTVSTGPDSVTPTHA